MLKDLGNSTFTLMPYTNYVRINNRRYLGSKHKLAEFIKSAIEAECGNFSVFADLFAGTGVVASMFQDRNLILNDILYSNHACYQAWFGTESYSHEKIANLIVDYNEIAVKEDNYFSKLYGGTYFNTENCRKIGHIRQDIERMYSRNFLNDREKCILITSLLYAMDKIANTCGHYDAFRKDGQLARTLVLRIPEIRESGPSSMVFNMDANELARRVEADVIYLDPPYNSRQYCDAAPTPFTIPVIS